MEKKKNFDLLQFGDNEDSIFFFIFSYLQWNMITTKLTSMSYSKILAPKNGNKN